MRYLSTALFVQILWAQSASVSQITGTVQDSTGLAVPGARVAVTQTDTGLTRTAESGADGGYILPSLPIGPYRLEVKKEGFSTYVQSGIVLQVNTSPTVDIALKVGSVSEQIVVEAAAALVETRSTGVGQVVDQQRIVDIPLNGRYATDLIYIIGAASTAPNADLVSTKNYPNEAVLSIAGGLANGTAYTLDGGTHNDPFNNLNLPFPFPDALQEFKVETSALPAQYGYHSAGAINAVTKAGTNGFHGNAFEFVRNYVFNARQFLAVGRDSLKRNQYGGTFGGPIKKDKLFFFLGYQGTIIKSNPTQSFSFIPTADMLRGDFTTIASATCNAGKPVTMKTPFVGNLVAPALFSPAALKMVTFYPPTSDPCGKEFYSSVANQSEHMGVAKVDYQLTSKQSAFLRYYVSHALVASTFDGKNPLSMTLSGADDLVNSGVFGHTYVLSPTMVNSFRATFNRSAVAKTQTPTFDGPALGIKMHTLVPGHLVASATGAIYSSVVFSYAAFDPTTSHQLADDVSIIKGNHQIGFGGSWIRSVQNVYGPLNGDGNFSFNGGVTGLSMGDFLTGNAFTFTQGGIQYDYERYHYLGLYVQDTWKATPHFTVSAGLRWEPYFGGSMSTGFVQHFDSALFAQNVHSTVFPNAPAGVIYPGDSGFDTNNRPAHVKLNDFAPRLGVVWDPKGNGRTTIRASWGIFYELPHTLFAYGFSQAPPWGSTTTLNNVKFDDPWASYPGGDPFPLKLDKNFKFPQPGNYTTYPLDVKTTYLEQWNFTIEKQIGTNWLAKASYLGNNTIHLWADRPINAAVFIPGTCGTAACSTTGNTNQRRVLYLQNADQGKYYGVIHQLDDGSTASYNALLLTLQHRVSSHFSVLGNYTWSHCIAGAFTSELDGVQYTNPVNRAFDRGNCVQIDRRQIFNFTAVEDAPKFSNRLTQMVAGDWKFSQIMRVQSGGFFTPLSGLDQALNGIGAQRPNLIGDPYPANQTYTQWINPSSFGQPALGTFGNLGPGSLRGPGSLQFDLSLARLFPIGEKQRVELRAEAFNILNHYRPNTPQATFSTLSTFGQITTPQVGLASDPRIMQFALKYSF